MVETTLASSLPPTRRQLLQSLKLRGEARAEELAEELGVTVSAVRQHLAALAAASLVEHRELKGAPGRPKHVYHLTEIGDELFPRAYQELANELLEIVHDEDPELLERVFERRRRRRLEQAHAAMTDLDHAGRVDALARLLDEDGYLADVAPNDDGSFTIELHNCAVLGVAQRHDFPCASEEAFLRDVLPCWRVQREAHVLRGDHRCAYKVAPPR